jgi:hypothetical protein
MTDRSNVDAQHALDHVASAIRALSRNVVRDVIAIGRHLSEAKKMAGHGHWLSWLKSEFSWSERTAERFIRVHEFSIKSDNLADLMDSIGLSALYLLTAPSTPAAARAEILERAARGAPVTHGQVKEQVRAGCVAVTTRTVIVRAPMVVREAPMLVRAAPMVVHEPSAASTPIIEAKATEKPAGGKADRKGKVELSGGFRAGLDDLAQCIGEVTPEQMIDIILEVESERTATKGWTLATLCSGELKNAQRAIAWLTKFAELVNRAPARRDPDKHFH